MPGIYIPLKNHPIANCIRMLKTMDPRLNAKVGAMNAETSWVEPSELSIEVLDLGPEPLTVLEKEIISRVMDKVLKSTREIEFVVHPQISKEVTVPIYFPRVSVNSFGVIEQLQQELIAAFDKAGLKRVVLLPKGGKEETNFFVACEIVGDVKNTQELEKVKLAHFKASILAKVLAKQQLSPFKNLTLENGKVDKVYFAFGKGLVKTVDSGAELPLSIQTLLSGLVGQPGQSKSTLLQSLMGADDLSALQNLAALQSLSDMQSLTPCRGETRSSLFLSPNVSFADEEALDELGSAKTVETKAKAADLSNGAQNNDADSIESQVQRAIQNARANKEERAKREGRTKREERVTRAQREVKDLKDLNESEKYNLLTLGYTACRLLQGDKIKPKKPGETFTPEELQHMNDEMPKIRKEIAQMKVQYAKAKAKLAQ